MPGDNQRQTIEQELGQREIGEPYFNRFYQELKGNTKVPNPEGYSWQQYKLVVDYLREQNVLGEDNQINVDGLNLFAKRKELEDMLKTRTQIRRERPLRTGGLLPCREREILHGNGGVLPCHQEDIDIDDGEDDSGKNEGRKK